MLFLVSVVDSDVVILEVDKINKRPQQEDNSLSSKIIITGIINIITTERIRLKIN